MAVKIMEKKRIQKNAAKKEKEGIAVNSHVLSWQTCKCEIAFIKKKKLYM